MKKSINTFLKHTAKDFHNQSFNPPVVRASTIIFKSLQEIRKMQKKYKKDLLQAVKQDVVIAQKDIIELDRRVNLLYSALEGKIMRIFPVPNDINNKWISCRSKITK